MRAGSIEKAIDAGSCYLPPQGKLVAGLLKGGLKGYEEYKNGCGFSSVRNAIVDAEKEAVADAVKDIPGANAGIGVFDDILQGRGIKEIASDGLRNVIEDLPGGEIGTGIYDGIQSGKGLQSAITDEAKKATQHVPGVKEGLEVHNGIQNGKSIQDALTDSAIKMTREEIQDEVNIDPSSKRIADDTNGQEIHSSMEINEKLRGENENITSTTSNEKLDSQLTGDSPQRKKMNLWKRVKAKLTNRELVPSTDKTEYSKEKKRRFFSFRRNRDSGPSVEEMTDQE